MEFCGLQAISADSLLKVLTIDELLDGELFGENEDMREEARSIVTQFFT